MQIFDRGQIKPFKIKDVFKNTFKQVQKQELYGRNKNIMKYKLFIQ